MEYGGVILKRAFKLDIKKVIALIGLLFFILIVVTVRPFTVQTIIEIQTESSDHQIGIYEGKAIKEIAEDKKHYIVLKEFTLHDYGISKLPVIKVRCTESQLSEIYKLDDLYSNIYLKFECSIFNEKYGKLVSIYKDNPFDVTSGDYYPYN